jgi:hypothetical protein
MLHCCCSNAPVLLCALALLLQQRSCPPLRAALSFPPLCARCTHSNGLAHTIDVGGRNAGVGCYAFHIVVWVGSV